MSTDLIEISNDLRTFTIPSNTILGVEHDMDVNELKFVAPRYFHQDVDLSELSIRIQYQSSDGNKYYRPAINITVSDTALYFSWLVNWDAFLNEGIVTFSVCFRQYNGEDIEKEFNTTIATLPVLKGLYVQEEGEIING